MASELESQFEGLCATILKTDNEYWEVKNKAVLQLIELTQSYEGQPPQVIQDAFTSNLFRNLKEPMKALISDLRSQQVRDACLLLVALAQVAGERMKLFLRDSFPFIMEGVKVPNKVMSGYVDECILMLIKYTAFKSAIPILAQEVAFNKAKQVRERSLDYLNEILISWELVDKDLDPLCDAIKLGLEDASLKAREVARIAYGNLFLLFPRRTEKIRSDLPKTLQQKLVAAENLLREGNGDTGDMTETETTTAATNEVRPPLAPTQQPAVAAAMPPPAPVTTAHKAAPQTPHHSSSSNTSASSSSTSANHSKSTAHHHSNTPSHSKSTGHLPVHHPVASTTTPAKTASTNNLSNLSHQSATPSASSSALKAPKETNEERAAAAIQASMRGALSRRRSIVKNPFLELSDSFGSYTSNGSSSQGGHSSLFRSSPEKSPGDHKKASPTKKKSPSRDIASYNLMHGMSSAGGSPAKAKTTNGVGSNKNSRAPSPLRIGKSVDEESHEDNNNRLVVNSKVLVTWGKDANKAKGIIRYVGKTMFATGIWVGVELDDAQGKNNGSVQGHYYFSCPTNHGLFVRGESVQVVEEPSNAHRTTFGSAVSDLTTFSDDEAHAPSSSQQQQQQQAPSSSQQVNADKDDDSSPMYEKNKKSASILKIKLSQLMNLLNQQLEIVEELEREEKKVQNGDASNTTVEKIKDLKEEVAMITLQEADVIDGFKNRWKDLLY